MDPLWIVIPIVFLAGAVALGALGRAVLHNPRGDFDSGFMFLLGKVYVKLVHCLRVRGKENIPRSQEPGPLIVVCNHTAGVDPVLVQTASPFFIRWIMAQDMRSPTLEWFWCWWRVIFVDRTKNEGMAIREAMRHLKNDGVIGIFPEGGIERPARTLLKFQPGVGLLIKRTKARVLIVTIDGTPQVDPAWSSLWRPSTSVVHFHPLIDYAAMDLSADEIVQDLRERFHTYTGWDLSEQLATADQPEGLPSYGRRVADA